MKRDFIIGFFLLAISIGLYASLALMEEPAAASFPRVVILIMLCLGLMLLIQSIILKQKDQKPVLQSARIGNGAKTTKSSDVDKGFPWATLIGCFFLIAIYFVVMEDLGFYVSAFLFFIIVTFILGRKDLTVRKGLVRIAIAFVFTAILFVLFNKLLVVQTPKGLLF